MSIASTQQRPSLFTAILQGLTPGLKCNEETLETVSHIVASYFYEDPMKLKSQAALWQGGRDIDWSHGEPPLRGVSKRPVWWGHFAQLCAPTSRDLEPLINQSGKEKIAVDLGCGNSDTAIALLKNKWNVICVDYSQKALNVLRTRVTRINAQWLESNQLTRVCTSIEEYNFPKNVDLILAKSSLMYCNPTTIDTTISKIYLSLKPGGHFAGSFFSLSLAKRVRSHDGQPLINDQREMGAWFVKDPDTIPLMLKEHGFEEVSYRVPQEEEKTVSIVFTAKKPGDSSCPYLTQEPRETCEISDS